MRKNSPTLVKSIKSLLNETTLTDQDFENPVIFGTQVVTKLTNSHVQINGGNQWLELHELSLDVLEQLEENAKVWSVSGVTY